MRRQPGLLQGRGHGAADPLQLLFLGPQAVHAAIEQLQGSDGQALGLFDLPGPDLQDLCAAAANVEHGAVLQVRGRPGAVIAQSGLQLAGDHIHPHAGGRPNLLHCLLRVADVPQGGGGKYVGGVQIKLPQQRLKVPDGPAGPLDSLRREHPSVDVADQSRHLLFGKQQVESALRQGVVDGQSDGVGPQVHNGEFHGYDAPSSRAPHWDAAFNVYQIDR